MIQRIMQDLAAASSHTGKSDGYQLLILAFATLVLPGLVCLAARLIGRHFERQRQEIIRTAARQAARELNSMALGLLKQLRDETRDAARQAQVSQYSAADPRLRGHLIEFTRCRAQVAGRLATPDNLGLDTLTTSQYQQLAEQYQSTIAQAESALAIDQLIRDICANIESIPERISELVVEAETRLATLKELLEDPELPGDEVGRMQRVLASVPTRLAQIRLHPELPAAAQHLSTVNGALEEAEQSLQGLLGEHRSS